MILISSELDLLDERSKSSNDEINIFNIPIPVQFKLLYKMTSQRFPTELSSNDSCFTHKNSWLIDRNDMQNLEVALENINVIPIPYPG